MLENPEMFNSIGNNLGVRTWGKGSLNFFQRGSKFELFLGGWSWHLGGGGLNPPNPR